MLQQTQVSTVIAYFKQFIANFPDINSLAKADLDAVLLRWAGLGYYARARNLHKTARIITQDYQGIFPTTFAQIIQLPGIGQSTAGAILSLGYEQKYAILDGNVRRVLTRYHQLSGHYGQTQVVNKLWQLAQHHTPNARNGNYTQAMMDLGATICTRTQPKCTHCPLARGCEAKQHQTQSQYPNPKPPRNKPTKILAMLIFRNQNNQIYLQKRPTKGIWGGLWSFVECPNNPQAIAQSIQDFGANSVIEARLPMLKHTFTHYHLHIYPIVVQSLKSAHKFHSIHPLKLGLPAPVGKIITHLNTQKIV